MGVYENLLSGKDNVRRIKDVKRLMKIMDFQKMKIKDWVNFARILRCGTRYCCCSAQRRYIRTLLTNYTAVS